MRGELSAALPPFVERPVSIINAVDAQRLAAQQIFRTGFELEALILKTCTPFGD
jgi:hypothetical protein